MTDSKPCLISTINPANIRLDEDVLKTSFVFVFRTRLDQDEYTHLTLMISEDVFKTSTRRLDQDQYIRLGYTSSRRLQNVFRTSSRRLAKTSSRHLQDVSETFSRRVQDIFKTSSRYLAKTFSRHLQNVFKTSCKNVLKTCSRRLQGVLQRCHQDFSRRIIELNCYC